MSEMGRGSHGGGAKKGRYRETHKGRHGGPLVTGSNDGEGHDNEHNRSADTAKKILHRVTLRLN